MLLFKFLYFYFLIATVRERKNLEWKWIDAKGLAFDVLKLQKELMVSVEWEVLESQFAKKSLKQKSWGACQSPQFLPQLLFRENTQLGFLHAFINLGGMFSCECFGCGMLQVLLLGKQSKCVSPVWSTPCAHMKLLVSAFLKKQKQEEYWKKIFCHLLLLPLQ